jgi:hypothetical protein
MVGYQQTPVPAQLSNCFIAEQPLLVVLQASRIVAQLLVAGATTVLRAASQAWHQALQSKWQMLQQGT